MASNKWTMIDRLGRPDNLGEEDFCFYYLVYTTRAGYGYSSANQEIINYKIPVGTDKGLRARPDRMPHKHAAIENYGGAIVDFMSSNRLRKTGEPLASLGERVGIIPMPPSMRPDDSDYDSRNLDVCDLVCKRTGLKLCRDIETARPGVSSHSGGTRSPRELRESLERYSDRANACELVFLVDDVLVTGAHFAAAKSLLMETGFKGQVFGLFYARAEY
ncbi:MAG: hypothetical protein PHS28_03925 [Atopobiaceae bacterium]|nr:hypothetical protein [Atopobiaceae bacterium]